MKYILIILIATSIGIGAFFYSQKSISNTPIINSQTINDEPVSQKVNEISTPQTLIIKKLGIETPIESVGLDTENKMDVPKNPNNAGWYNLGYKPGEIGSAVIAGHVDTPSGNPAIFYKLATLKLGDELIVIDESGNTHAFEVIENTLYDFDNVPLQEVFATNDSKRLNLITCDGAFDTASKNYSKRRVVYARALE